MKPAVRNLPARTRAIIGCWQMGVKDPKQIAQHIYQHEVTHEKIQFVKRTLRSPNKQIRNALHGGMPVGSPGHVFTPVKCTKCGAMVELVPCVACYMMNARDDVEQRSGPLAESDLHDDYRATPVPDGEETDARPGSAAKIEVMRRRVEQGQAAGHKSDRFKYPKARRITIPTVSVDLVAAVVEDIEQETC